MSDTPFFKSTSPAAELVDALYSIVGRGKFGAYVKVKMTSGPDMFNGLTFDRPIDSLVPAVAGGPSVATVLDTHYPI